MSETLGALHLAVQQSVPTGGFFLLGQPVAPGSSRYTYGALDPAGLPGGAPVSAGGAPVSLLAGVALPGHLALMIDGSGHAVLADPSTVAYNFAGISTGAAAAGQPVLVAVAGQTITEPSWAWTPGAALFLGTGGVLTATPPATGVLQQVAQALSPTTVVVQPFPPITLAPGIGITAQVPPLADAASGVGVSLLAGAAVSGHRALAIDGNGHAIPADPSTVAYNFIGISVGAAASGQPVQVAVAGQTITEPSWAWTPGAALFLGTGGVLTATPPATGVLQQVAQALSATTVVVQPSPPITLV